MNLFSITATAAENLSYPSPSGEIGIFFSLRIVTITVCLYCTIQQFFHWKQRRGTSANLLFSLFCFAYSGFTFGFLWMERASSIQSFLLACKTTTIIYLPLSIAFLWFIAAYSGFKSRLFLFGLSLAYVVLLAANMLTQTNMFYAEIHSLDQWTTFGGESITVPDAVVSSWSHGYFVLDMITALFCWWCVIWLFRRQEKRKAVRLGLANLAFVLTIVGYRLVRTLATGIPPVGELGVFAFILMMNTDLSSGLWRKLKQSNERLTSEINERLGVEKELRQLRNYLFNIINSMPSVLIGVDNDRKVTQWNKAAEQYTGVTAVSAEGKSLLEIFPRMASADEKIAESIRTGQVTQTLTNPRLTEDATFYEDLTIYPLSADGVEGAVIRIDDVTNKVRMEEMLIQSEKMLSMGGLAAGMAHEINNPIAGMMQTASVMADRLQKLDMSANLKAADAAGTTMEAVQSFMKNRNIPQMIATIIETGRRVAVIVNNMLSFARKSEAQVLPQSLPRLLDKALELAATDYDLKKHYDFKQIEIEREYEDSLPSVPCEGAKIQQVLLNILSNGAQAMANAETKRPRLIVRTKLESGQKMACIEIEDNGPGMTEATRKRIFEPFYTTKPEGEGTGLGLSVSYFIVVENHGGNLTVESRPGSGAKFTICLPLGKANA